MTATVCLRAIRSLAMEGVFGARRLLHRTQAHQQLVLKSQMAAATHPSPLHPTMSKAGREGNGQLGLSSFAFFLIREETFPPKVSSRVCLWPEMGDRITPRPVPGPGRWARHSGLKSVTLPPLGRGPWPAGGSQHQSAGRREGQLTAGSSAPTPELSNI